MNGLANESINTTDRRPLDDVACCRDVPEHRHPLEPSFSPEFRPNHVLDHRFFICGAISRSGMATIYLAQDMWNDDQPVAIKVPLLKDELDPNFYSRFEREEVIGRKLDHPFLLKFVPVENKTRPYLVTEYLSGCTLSHVLHTVRPVPENDALRIASLICEALEHMHERGVIHRDLKPGNIMICRDRTLRLLDFGIASSADARKITLHGFTETMGTPEYMSPEQVKTQPGDERSDIYCLGALLYEMLTGVLPFPHENCWASMNQRVTGDPVAPRKLNPHISPQAEEIVLHAMQRNPADRYQSAAAMKAELDAPQDIRLTGYCDRLQKPRWRLSMRETPVIFGTLIALGFILMQVLAFLLLRHLLRH